MNRIVYLHQYFKTPSSSGGTRSYEFARRLAAAGWDIHIVASRTEDDSGGSGWLVERIDGFTVHWIHVPYDNSMGFRDRVAAFVKFALLASRRARNLRGDLIFASSTPLTIAIPAIYAKAFRRTPMVFEVRDLWPELPIAVGALKGRLPIGLARGLERIAYKNAAEIVALSPGMKEGVVATGYNPSKVAVIPNSSDHEMFEVPEDAGQAWRDAHPEIGDRPFVLYCGTLGAINGVEYLAQVAAEMREINQEIAFVVVGAGAEEQKIARVARDLGVLNENFFLYPPIAKREVPALFRAATVSTSLFIPLPEMEANSANKFFDSLAAAKPVAINYGGWQLEILEKYAAGVGLDAIDHRRAAEQLAEMMAAPARLEAFGASALRLAKTMFSRDDLAAELDSIVRRVIVKGQEPLRSAGLDVSTSIESKPTTNYVGRETVSSTWKGQ